MAVTGVSRCATKWIMDERKGLLNVEDIWGRAPLHYCNSAVNYDLLLSKGADLDHTDKYGMKTLHRACLLGDLELVICLLKWKPIATYTEPF